MYLEEIYSQEKTKLANMKCIGTKNFYLSFETFIILSSISIAKPVTWRYV